MPYVSQSLAHIIICLREYSAFLREHFAQFSPGGLWLPTTGFVDAEAICGFNPNSRTFANSFCSEIAPA